MSIYPVSARETVSRVTRWVCEKMFQKSSPKFFLSKMMHNFYLCLSGPKIWATIVIFKTTPKSTPNQFCQRWCLILEHSQPWKKVAMVKKWAKREAQTIFVKDDAYLLERSQPRYNVL
jgi:hypothetical protein